MDLCLLWLKDTVKCSFSVYDGSYSAGIEIINGKTDLEKDSIYKANSIYKGMGEIVKKSHTESEITQGSHEMTSLHPEKHQLPTWDRYVQMTPRLKQNE